MSRVVAWARLLRRQLWAFRLLLSSRMLTLMRPDKYVAYVRVLRSHGASATTGFALAAVRKPDGVAIIDERGAITWADLQRTSEALAAGLADLPGPAPGSVAVLARNHRGLVQTLIASARLGVPTLLLNTGFSGPQLAEVVTREDADLIVYDEEFAGLLDELRRQVPGLREVVAWSDSGSPGETTVDGLVAGYRGQRPPTATGPGRVVLLTSGTTGTPKGARRSGGGADELAAMLERIPWHAEETVVVAAPIFHAWGFGQAVIAATMTCTVVMRRKFDPETTLRMVAEHDATGLAVVPVMLERIVDLPAETLDRYPMPTLRFVTASGSRMRPDAVTAFMDRFGDVVHNSYNATEAGQISVAVPADLRVAPDTAGRPVTGTDVVLVDDDGKVVAAGEVGRIAVRGASPFDGYTHGASKDFVGDFMVSGDVGRFDDAGRLYVVGRDDDMIVSGGENVYPVEVEKSIGTLEAVREVAVVGVDDDAYGQRLAAYVVPTSTGALDEDAVRAHVKQQLAGYKVPRDVVFLDELPRNAAGKVAVRELPPSGDRG